MENRALDNLFKTGLEKTAAYGNAEEQWEVVAARLGQPARRKPVWWWFLGAGIGIVLLCLVSLTKIGRSQPVIGAFNIPIATTAITPSVDALAIGDVSSESAEKFDEEVIDLAESRQKSTSVVIKDEDQNRNRLASTPLIEQEEVAGHSFEPGMEAATTKASSYGNRETIVAITESLPTAGVVHNIMTLPFTALVSNTIVITRLPAELSLEKPPVTKAASVARWALEIGVQQDFISSERIADSASSLQYYSAVAVNFLPHWQARMAYGVGNINRTITGDPSNYRVPIFDVPQDGGLLTATQLRYRNQNLEVQLAYHLSILKKLTVALHTGGQWNRETNLNAVYDYEGIYQPVAIETTLPDTKLQLSDLSAGVGLGYPLSPGFQLRADFQQYFSLDRSGGFRWPLRQRVQLGLSYHF